LDLAPQIRNCPWKKSLSKLDGRPFGTNSVRRRTNPTSDREAVVLNGRHQGAPPAAMFPGDHRSRGWGDRPMDCACWSRVFCSLKSLAAVVRVNIVQRLKKSAIGPLTRLYGNEHRGIDGGASNWADVQRFGPSRTLIRHMIMQCLCYKTPLYNW
jgi:hypothetical protein